MDQDEDVLLRAVAKERRSHQITWFIVLQIVGILSAVSIFPPAHEWWSFFIACWVITFLAWFLSKIFSGLKPEDERRS